MGTTQIITKLKITPSLVLEPSNINGEFWHRKTILKAFLKKASFRGNFENRALFRSKITTFPIKFVFLRVTRFYKVGTKYILRRTNQKIAEI